MRAFSLCLRVIRAASNAAQFSSPAAAALPILADQARLVAKTALPGSLTTSPCSSSSAPCPPHAWGTCAHGRAWQHPPGPRRAFSSSSVPDYSKQVEDVNTLFVEARDEIDYAKEDADTTYFNDSVEEAKKCVDKCLQKWSALLASLPEEESQKLQRSMGLKMEQLKAEFDILRKTHLED